MLPFLLRYENYLSPAPGPELFEVDATGPGPARLRWHSYLPELRPAGPQTRLLTPADLAAVHRLALEELDFFALPAALTPPAAARPELDWPYFTLRYAGREHACGGPGAGHAYPALGRLQALMLRLYERYILPP